MQAMANQGTKRKSSSYKLKISQETPKKTRFKRIAWLIWGAAALFYFFETTLRVSPGVMTEELSEAFMVSPTMLGFLSSFYYFAYVPLQVPGGLIVDKWGPRLIITCSSLICVVGVVLFAMSPQLYIAELGRFLIGAGSACAYVGTLKLATRWFPLSQFTLVSGLTVMMGKLGGTFGGQPLACLVDSTGWREAMYLMGGLGILVTLLCWFTIRDEPHDLKRPADIHDHLKIPMWEGLKSVLRNYNIWIMGIVGGLMYIPITAFAELWATPYLMKTFDVAKSDAAATTTFIFIGMAVGAPLAAWLSRFFKTYAKLMRLSAFIAAGIFMLIAYAELFSFSAMKYLIFFGGVSIGGQILCFAASKVYNTNPALDGTAIAFANSLVMLGGIIFQPLLGFIMDLVWSGAVSANGRPIYNAYEYHLAILSIPIGLFIGGILLSFLRPIHKSRIPSRGCA